MGIDRRGQLTIGLSPPSEDMLGQNTECHTGAVGSLAGRLPAAHGVRPHGLAIDIHAWNAMARP